MSEQAITQILDARTPREVFGNLSGYNELHRTYRRLSKVVHPDTCTHPQAGRAFAKLSDLRDRAEHLLEAGRYNAAPSVEIKGNVHSYFVGEPTWPDRSQSARLDDSRRWVVKVFAPSDTDLATREAEVLRKLNEVEHPQWYPRLEEHFRARSGATTQSVTVLEYVDGLVTMGQVLKAYPDGVPAEAMAWMFRRLLIAIAQAHALGFVHGAVIADHVLVHPELHGIVLVDWKYSVPLGQKLKAVPSGFRPLYVRLDEPADQHTDMRFATLLMMRVMGAQLGLPENKPIRTFLRACFDDRNLAAVTALVDFTDLIERMWGARKFVPFKMPHARGA